MYKLTRTDAIIRLADGATVPPDEGNADHRAYLAWVSAGNAPEAADPAPIVYASDLRMDARVRTTDATPTEVYRRTLRTLTGYAALVNLLAVDAGNGAVRLIRASIVAKRLGNGAILVGAPVVLANHQDAGTSGWAIAAGVSGDDFVITVTGASGRTVDWLLDGRIVVFTPGGDEA